MFLAVQLKKMTQHLLQQFNSLTPEPEPPAPTKYTLTVTASEGGTVSTEGGTYDEGTEVTITATAMRDIVL